MKAVLAMPPLVAVLAYLVWRHFAAQVMVGDLAPFDLRLYGYADAQAYLAGLTDTARAIYLGPLHRADSALMAGLTISLLLPVWRKGWLWCVPALLYLVFDILENRAVSMLLTQGLGQGREMMTLSLFTGAKFAGLAVAALLAGWSLWATLRKRG